MLIGGFWHGANWTFVVWGAIHGFGQALAWAYREFLRGPAHARFWDSPVGEVTGWLLTMATVLVAWVFFRAPTLGESALYLSRMLGGVSGGSALAVTGVQWALAAVAVGLHVVAAARPAFQVPWPRSPLGQGLLVGAGYFACVAVKSADAPFIYFNF
jgi:alginate O-acetyltransferase complex protein AlgI